MSTNDGFRDSFRQIREHAEWPLWAVPHCLDRSLASRSRVCFDGGNEPKPISLGCFFLTFSGGVYRGEGGAAEGGKELNLLSKLRVVFLRGDDRADRMAFIERLACVVCSVCLAVRGTTLSRVHLCNMGHLGPFVGQIDRGEDFWKPTAHSGVGLEPLKGCLKRFG